jgi:hypothetical protein
MTELTPDLDDMQRLLREAQTALERLGRESRPDFERILAEAQPILDRALREMKDWDTGAVPPIERARRALARLAREERLALCREVLTAEEQGGPPRN